MKIEDIRCILIIGAGTMGQEIGLQCAMYGYDVVLYDISSDKLETAMSRIKTFAEGLAVEQRLTRKEVNATLARIITTTDPNEAAARSDLVNEAVPENPKLKRKVFAQFNKLCPQRTIFTTNTSSFLPSKLAKATGRPAQFAALHFHPHVWENNVVDIMPHPGTAEETMILLGNLAKRIGQIPIFLKKESPGYVFNAMYGAFLGRALELAANDIATVEDIDRVCMRIFKQPLGPFGLMDIMGLDVVWDITKYWAKRFFFLPRVRRSSKFLKQYIDRGHHGVKNGQGFYTYPNPAFEQPGFIEGEE